MSNSFKTLITFLGTTGVVATGGAIYSHAKSLESDNIHKNSELLIMNDRLELDQIRLELDQIKLELEKYKNNIPSTFDKPQPPLDNLPTPERYSPGYRILYYEGSPVVK